MLPCSFLFHGETEVTNLYLPLDYDQISATLSMLNPVWTSTDVARTSGKSSDPTQTSRGGRLGSFLLIIYVCDFVIGIIQERITIFIPPSNETCNS